MRKLYPIITIAILCLTGTAFFTSCKERPSQYVNADADQLTSESPVFQQRKIADSASYWWAHTPSDVTGDGIADLLFINNNASGGYLGYYQGQKEAGPWALHIIANTPPNGGLFAAGDLEAADVDGDGDMDVIGIKHPGEWTDAGAEAEVFWFENELTSWTAHAIGTVPDAVKDISFADFDKDGKTDLAILTFEEHTLSIFKQHDASLWERVQFIENEVLHEGMAIGDLNNDGYLDIVATGLLFYNPGSDISRKWRMQNLDAKWNDQQGDWSRNGTKTFIKDIDGDGKVEIFMAHSERAGYPLVVYKKEPSQWAAHVIKDSIPACHTLQVFDFNNDGHYDILAGVNYARAVNLDKDKFDVSLFLSKGTTSGYSEQVLDKNGIYNGQAIDYDGDGDIDIFRYPNHEATDFFLLENTLR